MTVGDQRDDAVMARRDRVRMQPRVEGGRAAESLEKKAQPDRQKCHNLLCSLRERL
jgi:hypothetical protein